MDRSWRAGHVNCGQRFGVGPDSIYPLLGGLQPGLMVDAGAAIGMKTREMLKYSPASRVVAYEPFPGNLAYLNQYAAGEPRVTVRPAALADRHGREQLNVAQVVDFAKATHGFRLPGFSALGELGGIKRGAVSVTVDVVRLDEELDEPVRFLKIDVQGSERRVLEGAAGIVARHGIDLAYVEFGGSLRVLRLLEAQGFVLFDSLFLAWPTRRYWRNWFRREATEMPRWNGLTRMRTTMGGRAARVWPPAPFRRFWLYAAWLMLNRIFRTGLSTDLICVHRSVLERFFDLAEAAATANGQHRET